jgi:hypothetical protein
VLYDVAMAPTGEAFGFFKSGDGNGLLAFRQSGALSQFDLPGGTVAPFASGDTSITPLGVTIDPDGAAAAVYKSLPSGALLQTVRPANGSWGAPTVIANVPALAGSTFDHAPDGSAALISRTDTVVRASVRPPGGAFGAEVDVATAGAGQTILISPAIAAVNGGNAVLAFNRSLDGGCGANNDARWEAYGYKSGVGWNLLEQGPSTFPQRSRFDGLDAGGANVGLLVENFVYAGSCGAPGAGSASLDAYIGTHESLGGGSSLGSGASGIFIAVGPAGDALVALNDPASGTVQLRAFEDAAPIGDGGGGSNQGGGNPPITAPSKAVLKGPIVVKQKTATIEFQCNGAYECALVMSLLGAKPKKSASTAKAAAPFAKVKGKVAPGTSKKFKLKLTSAALKKLKSVKSHKLTVYVQSVVTSGGSTSTVVQKATLKR